MMPVEATNDQARLHFESSDHHVLGMQGPLIDKLRDNAPRVVGGLRLVSILMASVAHPLLGLHALFVLGSEVVLLLFGNRERIEGYKTPEGEKPFLGPIGKALQPHKYPIESSAALDVLGEIPHLILGASIVFNWDIGGIESLLGESPPDATSTALTDECGDGMQPVQHGGHVDCLPLDALPPAPSPFEENYVEKYTQWQMDVEAAKQAALEGAGHQHLTGIALTVHGALGVLGHLPLWLFGPEKTQQANERVDRAGNKATSTPSSEGLEFAEAKSTVVGALGAGNVLQWFTNHQVMISSVLQAAMAVTMMVATGMPDIYQLAGVPLLAGAVLQGMLVNKADFSAEAKKKKKQLDPTPERTVQSHVHSVAYTGKVKLHDPTLPLNADGYGLHA